jgi:5-methylthioadenosine/S-adenosylhomocysteine deaminase
MPAESADLRIDAHCIVSMSSRGQLLEGHSLLVRDGRILDILPTAEALNRYQASVVAERGTHVLIPGLIDGHAQAALSLRHLIDARAAGQSAHLSADFAHDSVSRAIAAMLKSGTTCFADRSCFPADTARAVQEQGMRAVIGLPVTGSPSPWAESAAEYLSRALQLRDEYRSHPLISTVFAPLHVNQLDDDSFARLSMLANELDAGIMLDAHSSPREIAESESLHGARPLARLAALGLLSPSLNAVHMNVLDEADIELAQRSGISICCCPHAGLQMAGGPPPLARLLEAGLRVNLGSASAVSLNFDLRSELWLCAALLPNGRPPSPHQAWDMLALATCGAAAALGLDPDVGTLQAGKWADLCCIDVSTPAAVTSTDPLEAALSGGAVSDVWVAGRQLVANGELTRLDWAGLASKTASWRAIMMQAG